MKRIALLLLSLLLTLSLLSSCAPQADFDLTDSDPYDAIVEMIDSHEKYTGKTVRVCGESSLLYNFSKNSVDMMLISATKDDKIAYYEVKAEDGKYPLIGTSVTVFGSVTADKHLAVENFGKAEYDTATYDIDTLDMSTEELRAFIEGYNADYDGSEHYGKTIRIFGHCESSHDKLKWLLGLDEKGAFVWDIELYDPTGEIEYPTLADKTVNPVEIIGKLSTYESDGITYACIEVVRVIKVQSVFK